MAMVLVSDTIVVVFRSNSLVTTFPSTKRSSRPPFWVPHPGLLPPYYRFYYKVTTTEKMLQIGIGEKYSTNSGLSFGMSMASHDAIFWDKNNNEGTTIQLINLQRVQCLDNNMVIKTLVKGTGCLIITTHVPQIQSQKT